MVFKVKKLWIFLSTLLIACLLFIGFGMSNKEVAASSLSESFGNDSSYFYSWKNGSGLEKGKDKRIVPHSEIVTDSNEVSTENSNGYRTSVYKIEEDSTLSFSVSIETAGLYSLTFDYYSLTENILPIKYSMKINGEVPYSELTQLILKTFWTYDDFKTDRYGNELGLNQKQVYSWNRSIFDDASGLNDGTLEIPLKSGTNKIEIEMTQGSFLLGEIYISPIEEEVSYSDYLNLHDNNSVNKKIYSIESENLEYKNNANIQVTASRDLSAEPLTFIYDKINVVDGSTFNDMGSEITYKVNVDEAGYYKLAIKSMQNEFKNKSSFLYVKVNGEIPFKEASKISIGYSSKFKNNILGDYLYYLEKGENSISIGLSALNIRSIYLEIKDLSLEINNLGLDIVELTGNNSDSNRDWDLKEYIPDAEERLLKWKEQIKGYVGALNELNGTKKNSLETQYLNNALKNIDKILEDLNELPYRLSLLNKDSGSITYFLSQVIENLNSSPITIDKLYVYTENAKLKKATKNIFFLTWKSFSRFVAGLFKNKYDDKDNKNEVTVWVERPRQYVDVMQMLTDSKFTPETGIKVKFSVLSDESKLLLANASNQQPDIAMNLNAFLPYQYAIRDALVNFRSFPDYKEVFDRFYYQSYVQYIFEDGIYAVPETQNFQIMFYRKDVFDSLGVPVPKTWDDVIAILPELQRYGMNFYTPLSQNMSFKIFNATLPYLLQRGVSIYTEDGLSPNLDTIEAVNAIEFMCDLYNIYSLPTEAGSFYNEFRTSSHPIGIGDINNYIQLTCAAPEISGLWGVENFPGTVREDGTTNYSVPGLSQPIIMFKKSDLKNEAWGWIKWWMEEETQLEYEELLTTSYGEEYMWNSANMNALSKSLIAPQAKAVILKQINNLKNIEMVPGYYMMEQELSNIWNKAALGGGSVRDAIDSAMITITREMNRKNMEFGYMDTSYNKIKGCKTDIEALLKEWGLI